MAKKKKKKRRRRRPSAPRGPERATAGAGRAEAEDGTEPTEAEDRAEDHPAPEQAPEEAPRGGRRGGLLGRGFAPQSPYPPLWESLSRGFRPVGASAWILGVAVAYVLAAWGFFIAAGAEPTAGLMGIFVALPPIPTLFDGLILLQETQGIALSLGLVVGITLVRTMFLGLLVPLVVQAVEGRGQDVREALGTLRGTWLSLFGVLTAELGLSLAAFVLVQGFLGLQLAIFAVWLLGLHFLVMAPVVIGREGVPAAEGLRRAVRAARLPGLRHISLVIVYFFVVQVVTGSQTGVPFEATPSIPTWVFVLSVTFIHLGVLGALCYRWSVVREQVPAGPARRPRAKSR